MCVCVYIYHITQHVLKVSVFKLARLDTIHKFLNPRYRITNFFGQCVERVFRFLDFFIIFFSIII